MLRTTSGRFWSSGPKCHDTQQCEKPPEPQLASWHNAPRPLLAPSLVFMFLRKAYLQFQRNGAEGVRSGRHILNLRAPRRKEASPASGWGLGRPGQGCARAPRLRLLRTGRALVLRSAPSLLLASLSSLLLFNSDEKVSRTGAERAGEGRPLPLEGRPYPTRRSVYLRELPAGHLPALTRRSPGMGRPRRVSRAGPDQACQVARRLRGRSARGGLAWDVLRRASPPRRPAVVAGTVSRRQHRAEVWPLQT